MHSAADRHKHLKAALEGQVRAGAPGALARLDAPGAGLSWADAAGRLAYGGRSLRASDAFRAASVTKSVRAVVAVKLAREANLALDEPLSL